MPLLGAACPVDLTPDFEGMTPTDKNDAPRVSRKPWHRIWPLAGIGVALLVNAAWISLLGYAVAKLLAGDAGLSRAPNVQNMTHSAE